MSLRGFLIYCALAAIGQLIAGFDAAVMAAQIVCIIVAHVCFETSGPRLLKRDGLAIMLAPVVLVLPWVM